MQKMQKKKWLKKLNLQQKHLDKRLKEKIVFSAAFAISLSLPAVQNEQPM